MQKMSQEHPSILTVIVLCAIAAVLAALFEIWAAWCLSLKQLLLYGTVWTAVQFPFLLYRASVRKACVILLFWAMLLVLYVVPWNSRKVFLMDFHKVRAGMTRTEVKHLMKKYTEGTGWPALPADTRSSTLTEVSSGTKLETTVTDAGELGIKDAVVYRHSNEGCFSSDWGVIHFENGRVSAKEFMPD